MVMLSMVSPVMVGADAASPQPTWPVSVSILTSTLSALSIRTPAIFIACAIGRRTAIASTRLIRAGAAASAGRVGMAVVVVIAYVQVESLVLVEPSDRLDGAGEALVIGVEKLPEFGCVAIIDHDGCFGHGILKQRIGDRFADDVAQFRHRGIGHAIGGEETHP